MSKKIGFWSVLALVVGSQIGSAVFMLPASLAPFGVYGIAGWMASTLGAISLAIVFATLCAKFPKTGGPHVYIRQLFGKDIAFFAGWTYWVVSWVSTTAVIVATVGYFEPFVGTQTKLDTFLLEVGLLFALCLLNVYGVNAAGKAETFLTLLKFLPLFIVPIIAISSFDIKNLHISSSIITQSPVTNIAQAALLTLWGFVGLESATTSAGSVENSSKTIPKALIIGTSIVAFVYVFNSLSIMGLIPGEKLAKSNAPYADAAKYLFGGTWHLWVSLAAAIVCIGSLNAWVLTSGQISLGLAKDKMMPKIFAKLNSGGSPYFSVIISCLGIIPLLIITADQTLAKQVAEVIDFSVTSFLFIYMLCSLVSLVLALDKKIKILLALNSAFALLFCIWVISQTALKTIIVSSIFTLSGIPLYFFWYKKQS